MPRKTTKRKRRIVHHGMFVQTKQRRGSVNVNVSLKELRAIVREAEGFFKEEPDFKSCFRHLSPDVSFFISKGEYEEQE